MYARFDRLSSSNDSLDAIDTVSKTVEAHRKLAEDRLSGKPAVENCNEDLEFKFPAKHLPVILGALGLLTSSEADIIHSGAARLYMEAIDTPNSPFA